MRTLGALALSLASAVLFASEAYGSVVTVTEFATACSAVYTAGSQSVTVVQSTVTVKPYQWTDTAANSGTPFVIAVYDLVGSSKRQVQQTPSWLTADGNATTDGSQATHYQIINGQLSDANTGKNYISASADTLYEPMALSSNIDPLTTNFSVNSTILYWSNAAFDGDGAQFFKTPVSAVNNAEILARFNGATESTWTPVVLHAAPLSSLPQSASNASQSTSIATGMYIGANSLSQSMPPPSASSGAAIPPSPSTQPSMPARSSSSTANTSSGLSNAGPTPSISGQSTSEPGYQTTNYHTSFAMGLSIPSTTTGMTSSPTGQPYLPTVSGQSSSLSSQGAPSSSSSAQAVSPSGHCGTMGAGGTPDGFTCTGSIFGGCCSEYGYCGNTTTYCQAGCQTSYGSCTPDRGNPVTTSGECGVQFGNQTCTGGAFGPCCSTSGYCGTGNAYCGSGNCNPMFGECGDNTTTTSASPSSSTPMGSMTVVSSSVSSPGVSSSTAISSSVSSSQAHYIVQTPSATSTSASSATSNIVSSSQAHYIIQTSSSSLSSTSSTISSSASIMSTPASSSTSTSISSSQAHYIVQTSSTASGSASASTSSGSSTGTINTVSSSPGPGGIGISIGLGGSPSTRSSSSLVFSSATSVSSSSSQAHYIVQTSSAMSSSTSMSSASLSSLSSAMPSPGLSSSTTSRSPSSSLSSSSTASFSATASEIAFLQCPAANGTTYTDATGAQYVFLCDTDTDPSAAGGQAEPDMASCINYCSSLGDCDAVTYQIGTCYYKTSFSGTRPDTAVQGAAVLQSVYYGSSSSSGASPRPSTASASSNGLTTSSSMGSSSSSFSMSSTQSGTPTPTPTYACPGISGQTVNDGFGNQFVVGCNEDTTNIAYTSGQATNGWDDCFDICQNSAQLCTAFTYYAPYSANGIGPGICFLKNGQPESFAEGNGLYVGAIKLQYYNAANNTNHTTTAISSSSRTSTFSSTSSPAITSVSSSSLVSSTSTSSSTRSTSYLVLASPTPCNFGDPPSATEDDSFCEIDLPFSMQMYGQSDTHSYASTNGFISILSGSSQYQPQTFPDANIPNNTVAPLYEDLAKIGSAYPPQGIFYQFNAANTSVTYEYYESRLDTPSSTYHFTVAYDSTKPGIFTYTYYSVGGTADDGQAAAIGSQGVDTAGTEQGYTYSYKISDITPGLVVTCNTLMNTCVTTTAGS